MGTTVYIQARLENGKLMYRNKKKPLGDVQHLMENNPRIRGSTAIYTEYLLFN